MCYKRFFAIEYIVKRDGLSLQQNSEMGCTTFTPKPLTSLKLRAEGGGQWIISCGLEDSLDLPSPHTDIAPIKYR